MKLKTVRKATGILAAAFFACAVLSAWAMEAGAESAGWVLLVFSLALLVGIFVVSFKFWRCPHCGRRLYRQLGVYCQFCGKELDLDAD